MRDEYPSRLEDLKTVFIQTVITVCDEHPNGLLQAQQWFRTAIRIWERSREDEEIEAPRPQSA